MRPPRRILVPVDFTPCCAAALEYAALLGDKLGAEVHVLHVLPAPVLTLTAQGLPPLAVFAETQAGQIMSRFLGELQEHGVPAEKVHGRLATGDAATVILETISEGGYDLVVMGRHGRGAVAHFLLGSVAEKVARRAPVPVLTLHAQAESVAARVTPSVEARS